MKGKSKRCAICGGFAGACKPAWHIQHRQNNIRRNRLLMAQLRAMRESGASATANTPDVITTGEITK